MCWAAMAARNSCSCSRRTALKEAHIVAETGGGAAVAGNAGDGRGARALEGHRLDRSGHVGQREEDVDGLISRADSALYAAKRGRGATGVLASAPN